MRRIAVLLTALMMLGVMAGSAAAQEPVPEHGHIMLLHAVWTGSGPSTDLQSYRKCVDLAGGNFQPLNSHHAHLHFGTAHQALASAGLLIIPTVPFGPFPSCAALAEVLPPTQ